MPAAVIVTVATNVIASGKIQFTPELPHRNIDAFGRLSLGSYDHIALELNGNPLGLESDDLVFEKSADTHTAAMLANVSGTPLCLIDVAGGFGRDLAAQGEAAMVAFASDWLAGLYGSDVKKSIGRTSATRWGNDPWTLGAMSSAVPGGQVARQIMMSPVADRSGLPAKRRTKPYGARLAAPGIPASVPPTRYWPNSVLLPSRFRRMKRKRWHQRRSAR